MRWSLKIGQLAGIGIYVHWTFVILLVALIYFSQRAGQEVQEIAHSVGLVLALFACVVLHELGHALTARVFGVDTRDITLLPIGGVARLERMPEEPWQEFWIAVAGPAVNVVIAAMLFAILLFAGRIGDVLSFELVGGSFLSTLMVINVMLVLFNMLPAFPMDGGRVLRALLALLLPRLYATRVAAAIGQLMAVLFGLVAITTQQWMLLLIAVFVYFAARGEAQSVELRELLRGFSVAAACTRQVATLSPDDTLQYAMDEFMATQQQDFPIVQQGKYLGMLHRNELTAALTSAHPLQPVSDFAVADPAVRASDPLESAINLMQQRQRSALPVVEEGQLVGLLSSESIGQWTMLRAALSRRRAKPQAGNPAG